LCDIIKKTEKSGSRFKKSDNNKKYRKRSNRKMKRYYINKWDTEKVIDQITAMQRKANNFCNVAVKPYRGKKHDPANTVVVVVG
jgi:hypothetical protein